MHTYRIIIEELWSIFEKVTEILYSSLKLEIFRSGFHGIPTILFKLWGF
jgi:hypothetical protein